MRFGLLGPVMVERDGALSDVKSAMPRTVLAVLLLNANTVVSAEQLIEAVWDENPPASATASLHNHVMRLRRFLGDEGGGRIRSVAPGYVLDVEPGELDLDVFASRCAAGRTAARLGRWAEAAQDLAAGLALWRGEPVADVPGAVGRDARVLQLVEARLQAREGWVEAELELGRHREVIGELGVLAAEYPLREVFHGQLMLALYRADRQAEALDVFQALRRTLVDELGVEPSASIQELHRRILNADPQLATPAPAPTPPPAEGAPSAGGGVGAGAGADPIAAGRTVGSHYQLPADTRVFTGRARELNELIGLASAPGPAGAGAGTVVICAVDGMGGIGKTTLAVHAAHRVREHFPDGQLFLDLRGYTAGLEPMSAGEALDWLLRSLGVPPEEVPQDLGDRAAHYRDRLAGTRTLIILDNVVDPARILPLLPSGPGCLVLVTSRRPLVGLDGPHEMVLDVLPQPDAVALLHKVAGSGRVPEHHPAIDELIALCGYVPLAIRIAAARLRHHRVLRIEDVVAQLRDETSRLGRSQGQERDPTAVFESSYIALPPAEQDLFRQLGLVPGPDIDAYAAANLADTDHRAAERLLECLLDHNLLIQHTPGRYRFHDLIRVYAHARAAEDPSVDCEAALDRLLDYYQHVGFVADGFLARHTRPGQPSVVTTPAATPQLSDRAAAIAWMRTERDDLVAAIADVKGSQADRATRVVSLTAALAAFLQEEGPWAQAAALHRAAVGAARELGDRLSEANALGDLGRVMESAGDHAAAAAEYERALALYREMGSQLGEANVLHDVGRARLAAGDFTAAVDPLERSLTLFRELGDVRGQAEVLNSTAELTAKTVGQHEALKLYRQALDLARQAQSRLAEAHALQGAARCAERIGDRPAALADLGEAVAIYQHTGAAEAAAAAAELAVLTASAVPGAEGGGEALSG
jgi:DNA-binding SARP family transcriptional activator/tetratricopeptide (TPR) repeat protein